MKYLDKSELRCRLKQKNRPICPPITEITMDRIGKPLGFDPIWIGVVATITVGMITPPVGLNLYVYRG